MPSFADTGFTLVARALTSGRCNQLATLTELLEVTGPGTRCLLAQQWAQELAAEVQRGTVLRDVIPHSHVAVQCTYFEKSGT